MKKKPSTKASKSLVTKKELAKAIKSSEKRDEKMDKAKYQPKKKRK